MTRRLVADASAIVALLTDHGPDGQWAAEIIWDADLYAPTILPFECANIFRRHELAEIVSADQAAQAHADLVELPIDLWPYETVADRVWELRANLTSYDAAYVAVAEATSATLVTLDRRIARAAGARCAIETRLATASESSASRRRSPPPAAPPLSPSPPPRSNPLG